MKIKIIHSDDYTDNDINDIKELLINNPDESGNYDVDDWDNKPHTLLYVLFKDNRFNSERGGLVLIYDNNKLCGISGYNRSTFNSDVYILGARTIIDKEYRHRLLMSSYFIPTQIEQVRDRAKMVVFIFDKKNVFNLYDIFTSGKLNLFLKNKYQEFAHIWDNLKAVEFPIIIYKGTIHNALYINIDPDYSFDWDSLRANHV
jgi:hypothetical protein